MTSRERVICAINHEQPDRVPIDLGSTMATGIHGRTYANLKIKMGISEGRNLIYEPFQFLADVEEPMRKELNIDTCGLHPLKTMLGYTNKNWKTFPFFEDVEVFVSEHMQWDVLNSGDIVVYPQGNRNAAPSAKMPSGGSFFDAIIRQEPIIEDDLDAKVYAEQTFSIYTDEECRYFEETSKTLYENSDYAIVGSFLGASFSRLTEIMGPYILQPKGVRNPEEWFVSLLTRKDYIQEIHQYQFEIGMTNLELFKQAVDDRIQVILMSGTDFGAQNGLLISPEMYRDMFKPLHKEMNQWVHTHTSWKTLYHTCGSIVPLLEDFHEAGLDILNPVQISAAGMDPHYLKQNFGNKFVFWGGGVDTQNILPFKSEEEVRSHVRELLDIFAVGGGYVFCPVHNIQDKVPVENIQAMFDEVASYNTD